MPCASLRNGNYSAAAERTRREVRDLIRASWRVNTLMWWSPEIPFGRQELACDRAQDASRTWDGKSGLTPGD